MEATIHFPQYTCDIMVKGSHFQIVNGKTCFLAVLAAGCGDDAAGLREVPMHYTVKYA